MLKKRGLRVQIRRVAGTLLFLVAAAISVYVPLPAVAAVKISGAHLSPKNAVRPLRKQTEFIILHTTEGSVKGALEKLSRNGECHYVVDTNGQIYRIIDRRRVAFHAGRSMWNGVTDLDTRSIGIEIVGYHNRNFTNAQFAALKSLVADLKRIYRVPDERILTHSMVAYGAPNRWQRRSHRGRKRCGMQMASNANRAKIGVFSKPSFDPDLRAGRLANADPELTRILYDKTPAPKPQAAQAGGASDGQKIGAGRSAWDIARDLYNAPSTIYVFPNGTRKAGSEITNWKAIPAGTAVIVDNAANENPEEGLRQLGRDGSTASEIAGDEFRAASTFYFFPSKTYKNGTQMTDAEFRTLPKGTQMLVGYSIGGPIASGRPAFSICGIRWNRPDTYYFTPKQELIAGDKIGERSIPHGTMIFFRK